MKFIHSLSIATNRFWIVFFLLLFLVFFLSIYCYCCCCCYYCCCMNLVKVCTIAIAIRVSYILNATNYKIIRSQFKCTLDFLSLFFCYFLFRIGFLIDFFLFWNVGHHFPYIRIRRENRSLDHLGKLNCPQLFKRLFLNQSRVTWWSEGPFANAFAQTQVRPWNIKLRLQRSRPLFYKV